MLATIRGPVSSITIDLQASVQWTLSDTRRHGEARLTIPRNTAAWTPDVLNEDGGFFVEISTPFGLYRGVADVPSYSEAGAEIIVRSITHWLAIRHVGYGHFQGLTPGAIARLAFNQGISTAVPLTLGPILEAPPIIPEYEFRGQSVLDIFTDISELSSQTWEIDDLYRLKWIPQQGLYKEFWVIDDGRFLPTIQTDSLGDTYSETIEIEQGRSFTAFSYAPPLWPQQRIVNNERRS